MRRRVSGGVAVMVLAMAGWTAGERGVVAEARAKSVAVSAASSAPSPAAATMEVKIDNFSFGPTSITVAVGTTVTWTNRDDIPHTVVSTDGVFKSKVMDTDEKFSFTFTKAGTFAYFCSIHPKMTGTVVVQ
jgi:plastocyanin